MARMILSGFGNNWTNENGLQIRIDEEHKTAKSHFGTIQYKSLVSVKGSEFKKYMFINNSIDVKTLEGTHGTTFIIDTWAPAFHGFYESQYSFDDESCLNDINYDRENGDEDLPQLENTGFISVDMDGYKHAVCTAYVDACESAFRFDKLVHEMKFQSVVSPRYYNFETDSINCSIALTQKNREELHWKIATELKDEFSEYLVEKFTPRSGFSPCHSSEYSEWYRLTNGFRFDEGNDYSFTLGLVLQFLIETEEVESEDWLYDTTFNSVVYNDYATVKGDEVSEFMTLTEEQAKQMSKDEVAFFDANHK